MKGLFETLFARSSGAQDLNHWVFTSGGRTAHTGVTVTEQNALHLTPVFRCISIISEGLAQLPIDVGRKTGETRELVSHPLDEVLNVRSNPHMSAFVAHSTRQSHVLGYGNGYAEIQRNGHGEVVGLWPLLPDRTWPETTKSGKLIYKTNIDGETLDLPADNVLHVPGLSFDGYVGYSPIALARNALGLSHALEEFGGKYFRYETQSGGILEAPGKVSDKQQKNLTESFGAQGGLSNAHRVKLLEGGIKFIPTPVSHEDAQFLETRQFQIEEVSRMYGVPLFMLSSETKSTSWGTGIGQMSLGFVRYTLQPWIVRTEQEYRYKLLTPAERKAGVYIKHNVNSLLRGDSEARSSYYSAALSPNSGWMSVNEVRALEELNPLNERRDEIITGRE